MNKAELALRELHELDALAAQTSPIHRLHPLVKLLATVLYILTVVSFDKYALSGLMILLLYPALLFTISGTSVRTCVRKLRFVLPLVLAVGILNPFLDRTVLFRLALLPGRGFLPVMLPPVLQDGTEISMGIPVTGGLLSMLTLMLKGILSLAASFLLIATTRIDALCAALRMLHLPELFVTHLLLTYRYTGVLTEELAIMTDAYRLRAPGQHGIHVAAWGSFLGQLLLRSMDRAQELYESMKLRGYHGAFPHADVPALRRQDVCFLLLVAAFCLAARLQNLTMLLGAFLA